MLAQSSNHDSLRAFFHAVLVDDQDIQTAMFM
jgi:hypothetical protein